MSNDLLIDSREGVTTITFNRPDQRNALDYNGWVRLRQIANDLSSDCYTKVVVLTGYGDRAFSSGADIKDFSAHRNNSKSAKEYAVAFDGAMDAVASIRKPTISLIKGFCIGGGCELSLATDIRIAAENAKFGIPVARLGILVGYKEMRRLVNLVGPGNASYILLSGRILDAKTAVRMGLVNSVVSISETDRTVYDLAKEMSKLAPLSHSGHKKIMGTVLNNPSLNKMTENEEHLPFSVFDSNDFAEGRRAFLEDTDPIFKGD